MKRNTTISRMLAALLTVCLVFGMLPITTSAFQSAKTETMHTAYENASVGDLLYTLNFNFDNYYFYSINSGTDAGTYTVSGDNGEKVSVSDKSASAAFYGGSLHSFKIPDKVYTVSYYMENSDWSSLSAGVRFFTRNTYLGLVSNPALGGQMCLLRNSTAYEPLDGDVEIKTDASRNNRRYFKTVIDGVHGILQFYALSTKDTYELLGSVDIDLNYNIHSNYYHLRIGMFNGAEVIGADQEVSLGDVGIYKGNTAVAASDYQILYDAASDGDLLYDVDFNDLLNHANGWDAFLGSENAVAGDNGNRLTLQGGSASAIFPDRAGAHYGPMTYEFYLESDSPVGMWFLGNTAGGRNYRTGFSFFHTASPEKLFIVNDQWYDIDAYGSSSDIDRNYYKGLAVLESQFGAEKNIDQTPDTRADDPSIEHNVKIEFDPEAKKVTAFILKDGQFKESVSLYYAATTFYPVFGLYQLNADAVTTVENFTVKKGLTSGIVERGVKFDHFLMHDNDSKESLHPLGNYYLTDDSFDALPMTISVWVNLSRDGYGETSYVFDYLSENRFNCIIDGGVPKVNYRGTTYTFSKVKIGRDTWTHLAITCGAGANGNEIRCYINGSLAQTLTASAKVEPLTGIKEIPAELWLGGYANEMNRYPFAGYMGDLSLYSDVRTEEEIKADMIGADLTDEDLLVSYNLFDSSFGETIPDVSGKGYDIPYGRTWLTEEEMEEKRALDPVEYVGSIAVLPDTQYCLDRSPASFPPIFDYLVENVDARKIEHVLHLGDVTDRSSAGEWTTVKEQYDRLNGLVGYSMTQGNHDRYTSMNNYFGDKNGYYYKYLKENGGLFKEDSIVNNYVLFTVGSVDYVVLNIAYERGEAILRWMSEVLNTYSDRKAIIISHSTLNSDSTMTSSGKELWAYAKKHPNVIMIMGGHSTGDSLTNRWDIGDYGNAVYQSRINAQHSDLYFDGLGMIAFFNFSEDGENVSVEYYSTRTGKYYHEQSQFTFSYDCYDSPLDGDHLCDACEKSLTVCADANKDHVCDSDSSCAVYTSGEFAHADANADHLCEYCGTGVKGEICTDASGDGNHTCDICGAEGITSCNDASGDGNHTCDECNAVVNDCADAPADGDHKCDECGAENVTVCADSDDADHYCDDCGAGVKGANCVDASGDGNHKCDVCGADGITKCADPVNDGDHKCDECGEIFRYTVDYSSVQSAKINGYPGGLRIDGFVEKVRYNSVAFKNSTVLPITNQKYEVSWWVEDSGGCSVATSLVYGKYSSTARHGWRTTKNDTTMVFYYNDNDIATVTTPKQDVINGRKFFKATVDAVTKTVTLYVLSDGEYKLADARTFSTISYLQFGIHNASVVVEDEHMAVGDLTVTPLCSDADGDNKCDECGADHECIDANNDYRCDVCGEEVACVDANEDNVCDICGTAVSYLTVTQTDGTVETLKDLKGGTASSLTVGGGTATYDADTGIVTFNNISASSVIFQMNGAFTLNLVGTNALTTTTTAGFRLSKGGVTVDGTGVLDVSGSGPALYVNGGDYYKQVGATVNLKSKGDHGMAASGKDIIIEGGTLNAYAAGKYGITAQNGGKILITGGTVISSAKEQPLLVNKTSASITIEGGTVNVTSRSSGKNCMYGHGGVYIKGGNVTVTAPGGRAILTNLGSRPIEISGGTVNITKALRGFYGVTTVSGGTVTSAATYLTSIASGKSFTVSGGTVQGSGTHFVEVAATATVTIGADADVNYTCTTQPIYDADGAYTLTVNDEGVVWETGKNLVDVAEARQIKTATRADYTAVNEAISKANALDRDLYKDFTAVDAAISAVVTGKYASEQDDVDAMAKAINDAIAALEYKGADYTAVNEAIAEASALNKLHYRDFSAVDSAVAAVIAGLDGSRQAEVDAMAKAIEEAISTLEKYDNIITVITTSGEELVLGMDDDDKNKTLSVGSGDLSYDIESGVVTLNNVTAQQIQFETSGDFTLNVVGENTINNGTASTDVSGIIVKTGNITVTGSGSLEIDAYSYGIHVLAGSYTQTGADVDVYVKYRNGIQTNGTLNVGGGTLKINAADRQHLYSNGGINVSGGRIEVSGKTNQILAYGTGFKMTDGTLIANGSTEILRVYAGACSIEGGTVEITGTNNLIISQTGCSVTISGGAVTLTSTSGNCINSGADITVSQADEKVPTVVTLSAASQAFRLNKENRTCSITGGTVTGSGASFIFTNTKSTVNVGPDAVIDFNCTRKPFIDADDSYTVILNTQGVLWEAGKELTDAPGATHIKTKTVDENTVRVRIEDGAVQYAKGFGEWTDLTTVERLTGDASAEIEVRTNDTHIQWRAVGDENWIDMIALEDLDKEIIGSSEKDFTVNFEGVTPAGTVFSVDIVWENGDFTFDYVSGTQGAWNPEDHTFGETTGSGWVDPDLKVTVVNHSNAAVNVTMAIADGDPADGLTVTSDKTSATLATAEGTTYLNAPYEVFLLTIDGLPTADLTKVATATLTFSKPE